MVDRYAIDRHKMGYHVGRVNDWLEKKPVFPIYIEVSPMGACNHRCTFCAVDYIGYQTRSLDTEIFKTRLAEMGHLGIKSIMYAGEGEPLLHKNLSQIINHTKSCGIDVSVTTNAVLLTAKWAQDTLGAISWVKVSINAGSPENYAQIHQTHKKDFDTVLRNLEEAVKIRNKKGFKCTIGSQMVLLPENRHEALTLTKQMKSIGVDYLVIKPYSQHKFSRTRLYENIDYNGYESIRDELRSFNDENFSVIFRENAITKLAETNHYYLKCQATPYFWAYIMADGSLYGCSAYLLNEKFCYGNIIENSFLEVWDGEKRRKNIKFVEEELEITE